MLLHYFGTKEALVAEVMKQVHLRLQSTFRELLGRAGNNTNETFVLDFWDALAARENQPALRLLFEVQMLALQNRKRYRRYLANTSASWRKAIEAALPRTKNAAANATLYNAVIDGLLLELLATGDLRRTTQALRIFVERCSGAPRTKRRIPK